MHLSISITLLSVLALGALPAAADEFTYSLTSDACSGGCGTAPFGTVDVKAIGGGTNGAGEVQVTVTLSAGDKFVNTGAAPAFGFNLVSPFDETITLSGITSGFSATSPQTAGSIHTGGFKNFEYEVECASCGSGGSHPDAGPLTFDVTESGLLAADFAQLSTGNGGTAAYFVADILGTDCHTGAVGAIDPGTINRSSTPEPTSIILLGTVAGFVTLKLKKKFSAHA